MQKFKNGEIVYLNSGSPKLNVTNVGVLLSADFPAPSITVSWVDDFGASESMTAPEVCFTREKP